MEKRVALARGMAAAILKGMFQFSRKVEYALAIVAHITLSGRERLHSARSIAEATRIPFDMVTKCLQRMHKQGRCEAVQGKHGGYRLVADPRELTLGEFVAAVFEPVAVADCLSRGEASECQLLADCHLRAPMQRLNDRIVDLLEHLSLAEFLGVDEPGEAELEAASRVREADGE